MQTRRRISAIALGLVLIWITGACSGSGNGGRNPSGSRLPSSPTALPAFTPADFQSLLRELRGKPVVVNIWASWCGPCRQEAPVLGAVSKASQGQVQFLGVDIEDQLTPARAFIHQYGWTYPSVSDLTGAIRDSLGLIGQPDTVVYDATGRRTFVSSGAVTRSALEGAIGQALRPPASTNPAVSPSGY